MIVKPDYFGGGSPCTNHSARSPSDRLDFQHLSKPPPANEWHATTVYGPRRHFMLFLLFCDDPVVGRGYSYTEIMRLNISTKHALFCRC